jgi:ABC-type nitrate/sulfonate/bicarbonate transport system ATPase subunit
MTSSGSHPPRDSTGVDPSNLWGNAREGSEVPTELQSRERPSLRRRARGDGRDGPSPNAAPGDGLALERVSFTYRTGRGGGVQALSEVSLHAAPGELLAVVGPSGCGKSTLLELICGLRRPDAGSVACAPAVLMPQRDLLLPWLDALDNAALALRIAGLGRAQGRERAHALFAELGLDGFERARPHELSGGMRQRVAFARTLLSGKPLLCLDEPFGALDAITRAEMQEWLATTLAREPRTVVLVTHDVEEAVLLADRVAVLSRRPGGVLAQLDVDLPRAGTGARPRKRTDPEVVALRERALTALATGGPR